MRRQREHTTNEREKNEVNNKRQTQPNGPQTHSRTLAASQVAHRSDVMWAGEKKTGEDNGIKN